MEVYRVRVKNLIRDDYDLDTICDKVQKEDKLNKELS